jgi:MoaA/NifB/PqqE/SkfB family radical SAM enzyme
MREKERGSIPRRICPGPPRAKRTAVWRALASNPQILKAGPRLVRFLCDYMGKFKIQDVGGRLILHSHLPPLNSRAYKRFIDEHLIKNVEGPSHAQVGLTNACPQKCAYCYSRGRKGEPMDTEAILRVVRDLREMGVFWLGFTGGEPLLNRDIVRITEVAAADCAVKLFTSGFGLTEELAAGLRDAGLFSVSVSLDHWSEEVHDRGRGFPGAYGTALRAVETFRNVGGVQVGISSVLSKELIRPDKVEEFLRFLSGLGVHEAWLSEAKPSAPAFWSDEFIISEKERCELMRLQDRWNKNGGITVNYLGHFESGSHFGCNAGSKMIYVDAFGEVSPCVFTPLTFGNVRERSLREIFTEMSARFSPSDACFMNTEYGLFRKYYEGALPLSRERTLGLLEEARFGPPPKFHELRSR